MFLYYCHSNKKRNTFCLHFVQNLNLFEYHSDYNTIIEYLFSVKCILDVRKSPLFDFLPISSERIQLLFVKWFKIIIKSNDKDFILSQPHVEHNGYV